MYRDAAINILQQHQAELQQLGIRQLSLFGSTARNEAREDSDIDIAIDLHNAPSGFAYFGHLDTIQERLKRILGVPVDVVPEPAPDPRIQKAIDQDRFRAF